MIVTKNSKNKHAISKWLIILFGVIIAGLIGIIVISNIYLSPIDPKDDGNIVFVVEQGSSKNAIAEKLEKEGLIRNALFFKVYIKLNINKELYAGSYNLSKSMSVDEIIEVLNSNTSIENEGVTVTFIEGKRFTDYAKIISDNFNYTIDEIKEVASNEEFINKLIENYWFITEDIKNEKIYYPLEGYLFPDTYTFKKNATIEEILTKMIKTMGQKLEVYKDEITVSNLNIHELLTLASIIELEGAGSDDRAGVAGVFYNRIDAGWSLGSDVTTYYGVQKNFNKDLSWSNLKACNGYNTRAESSCPIKGLPVGPICSPSLNSISSTIEPKKSDYFYFVADKNKKTYFSKTYNEHTKVVSKLKKEGLWYQY